MITTMQFQTLKCQIIEKSVMEWYEEETLMAFISLPSGLHDTVVYCSLHDPAAPNPPGYITNKVRSKAIYALDVWL